MKEIHTQIEINATPERVWKILTNFAAYPEWNPFIRSAVCQELKPGEIIEIALLPPEGEGWTFHPVLTTVHPERELEWLGRFILPGLFDGRHSFRIRVVDQNHIRFTQAESFRGVLVPFFGGLLEKTRAGFEEMNCALKQRAESTLSL
jgi:hypothetical protein